MYRGNVRKKIYINAQQQIPVQYGSMLHISLTNLLLLAAKQEPRRKAYISTQENGPEGRKKIRQKK